jgi:hypothetical protein
VVANLPIILCTYSVHCTVPVSPVNPQCLVSYLVALLLYQEETVYNAFLVDYKGPDPDVSFYDAMQWRTFHVAQLHIRCALQSLPLEISSFWRITTEFRSKWKPILDFCCVASEAQESKANLLASDSATCSAYFCKSTLRCDCPATCGKCTPARCRSQFECASQGTS